MNKTSKKHERNITKALTKVCEYLKYEIEGFAWITHTVDYAHFPDSLVITCVFDTQEHLNKAIEQQNDLFLIKYIKQTLLQHSILLNSAKLNLKFDTEENGASDKLL